MVSFEARSPQYTTGLRLRRARMRGGVRPTTRRVYGMRVIFMGTPEFAVPSLRMLIERAASGDLAQDGIEIVGVVTRVDKPSGRGRQVAHSPAKRLALEAGLPVFQPGPLRRAE